MRETFSRLWAFTEKRHANLLTTLGLSFLLSTIGVTQLLAVIAAVRVLSGEFQPRRGIVQILLLTLICVLGSFVFSYFQQINSLKSGMYSVADQRTGAALHLRRLPLGFFRQSTAKTMIATLTTTMQGVEMASTMTIVGIVSGLFNSVAICLFMLVYSRPFGLIIGLGIIAYLLVVRWQMVLSRKNAPARQAAQTALGSAALTFLQGIRVTKSFQCKRHDGRLREAIADSRDANIRLTTQSMPSQVSAHFTIAFFESLLIVLTVYRTAVTGQVSGSEAIILLIFALFAYASLDQAGSILSMIGMLESGLDEISSITDTPELREEAPAEEMNSEEICMENVNFSYGERQVLRNISACFKPGTLTAVIGPSGAGKTTLCQLIARFHDADSGSITIGGADLQHIPYDRLMEKISIVFQNVYLFEDTIANNIRFGKPNATMEEIRAAAKAARCDCFIEALPDGYDTMVQEGGSNLSGGEKQRISIARAILKDSPIIILDEATSALDAENEQAFFEAIDQLIADKTVIMIAHRMSTVLRADKIIAIQDGRVVQSGSPKDLAQQPGLFADFLSSRKQAAGWTLQNQ